MQQIHLDIRTLSIITTSIATVSALFLFLFGRMQKQFKGFSFVASGSASFAIGLLFLGYRGVLQDFITIIIANTIIVIGLVLYYEGSRRFLGTGNNINPIGIIAILLNIGIFLYYTYSNPSVINRIIWISAISILFAMLCLREYRRDILPYWSVPRMMMIFVFGGYSIFQVFRVVITLGEDNIPDFMEAGTIHALAFISVIILILGSGFGFIWMVSKKLEFDLTELANHDQLTNILNRRGVETLSIQELSKLGRSDTGLAVILTDIDQFKDLNDLYGHGIGDKVLIEFAQLIRHNLRPYDIFGRYGGDEFIIVLPNTTPDQALVLAERLRNLVTTQLIIEVENNKIQISASFGVTNYIPETNTLDKLVPWADKALYESKNRGRNQVTHLYPGTTENGENLYTLAKDTL